MNVLFICKWNQGRSQVAEALFKKYTSKHTCLSAGTHANELPGITLAICAPLVVQVLKEWDIDVSNKTTKRLTQDLIDHADKIVFMSKQRELPEVLTQSENVTLWSIDDPDGRGYEFHVSMRNQIDIFVKNFLSSLG
ncbi:hypothetical protein A2Z33_02585 [Candidatus Gottesmanbacteria bacterium RBG_16_52_11]|uniref:Phosphotyrosine protein phosphatase I domain-containing protein n=1 Tax=Candidatus Gottesmanbacteria bacterium RBG_16_52_11 TaxID=1798374 RepID=A0A1F5YND0_9BACT|nr:MAG: hypothetical protein A2Z33_02585 [Candidatus Gottesmanbacteria bacterium RBG_16_52_11]